MKEDLKNYISTYEGLKSNQDIIDNIDKRFFFEFTDKLIKVYKELEKDLYSTNELLNRYIDENKCLHCGKNIAGYCEECYQDLMGENAKLQLELKEYKENAIFICDPDKNKECKKTNCYKNEGECMYTDNIKFRKENIACGIDIGSGIEQAIAYIDLGAIAIEKHLDVFTEEEKEDYFYMINNIEVLIAKIKEE